MAKGFIKSLFGKKRSHKHSAINSIESDAVPDFQQENLNISRKPLFAGEESNNGSHEDVNVSQISPSASEENALATNCASNVTQCLPNVNRQVPKRSLETRGSNAETPPKPSVHIVVNNSSGFQIGDTFNFSLTDGTILNVSPKGFGLSSFGQAIAQGYSNREEPKEETEDNCIEDITDVITEDELRMISEHMESDWQPLGLSLDMSNDDLESLRQENPWSYKIAVLEMFHNFIGRYPDTSVGFIAAKLKESGHMAAYQQLENIRSR